MRRFALLWGLPLALVTAEMSSLYPDNGGYSIWVSEAFGEFWGFQESYWSWVSGVVDNALYPVLAFESTVRLARGSYVNVSSGKLELPYGFAFAGKLLLASLFTLPSFFTHRFFGWGLSFAAIFVMLPFIVLCAYGLASGEAEWDTLLEVDSNSTWSNGWSDLINVLYWNLSGFDCISTCAGEVSDPARSYPLGLLFALALVVVTYLAPLIVVTAVNKPDWHDWDDGWFTTIAFKQVGEWLAWWVVLSSVVGNFGMYAAELFEDSWQLQGMATSGLVPAVFGRTSKRYGTPYVAITFSFGIIVCMLTFDFNSILVVDNFFSCASAILELLAFYKIRRSNPSALRAFRVPLESRCALRVMLLFPMLAGGVVLSTTFAADWWAIGLNSGMLLFGVVLFKSMSHFSFTKYIKYNQLGTTSGTNLAYASDVMGTSVSDISSSDGAASTSGSSTAV